MVDGKSTFYEFKGSATLGIIVMIAETPITLGIGPIVDLATTSYFHPKSKFIDVKAILEGTPPRSKSELREYVRRNSATTEGRSFN